MTRFLAALLIVAIPACATATDDPTTVFEERILPIFKSPDPSSCVRCHLAAVDIKHYILPSATDTFLVLRKQGLIDLQKPENSKILLLISRGQDDPKAAGLITAKRQKAEYDAFAAWIQACATNEKLRAMPDPEKLPALATQPVAVIRHTRKDRVLESFERNIWAMRFRCMNCHTEGTPQNDKLAKEHGERVAWFKKDGPEVTMDFLLASKLIDSANPEKSLLLTKPLNDVKHGGGVKFVVGDQGYKAFREWIEDVVAMRAGKYAKATDLPAKPNGNKHFGSDIWFKLENTPVAWGDKLLMVEIYAWDTKANAWEATPVATSDRVVFGKGKLWQHTLTLLAEPDSARAKLWSRGKPELPAGEYLAKVFVDTDGKLLKDWKANFAERDFAGQIEFQAKWREGYGAMTVADASKVKP